MAAGEPTLLPDDPAIDLLLAGGTDRFYEIVRDHPASGVCWALLAEGSVLKRTPEADIAGYAYARTGYHRGLDSLRRAGWKGSGHIPWDHQPNQGFLRCLWALSIASERVGDHEEAARCAQFLRDSSEDAYFALSETAFD